MENFLSKLFSRATRLFKGIEPIAGDRSAVINENGAVSVYLPKEYDVSAEVYNVNSLMDWFTAYGKKTSVAFVDMIDLINGDMSYRRLARLIVMSSTGYNEKSICTLLFRVSKELEDWREIMGHGFTPQELRRFLQNRRLEYNEEDCELFKAMCNLNMSVNRNYELEDDGGVDRKLHFEVKAGSDFTHLPRSINLTIPMLFGDTSNYSIPVELEFTLPNEDNGNKPRFRFTCEFLDRLMIERVKECVAEFEEMSELKAILGNGGTVEITPEYKRVIGG